ncbi:CYTH domain-containing protein [Ditylenchus destructor]|nr:CYTH domain-containing protein [Ditylenchus destructor]
MGTHRRHNSFRATSAVSDIALNARKAATRSAKKNSSILLSAIVLRISSLLWILVGVLWKKVVGVYIWMLKLAEQYFAYITGWSRPMSRAPAIEEVKETRKDMVAATIEGLTKEMSIGGLAGIDAGPLNSYKTVTLKARVDDVEQMESAIFHLTESMGYLRFSQDIYFDVPFGQMKLRIKQPGQDRGELISYKQTNNIGPNFSESRVTEVHGVQRLRNTLALSLTELGTISKKRRIYVKENIHVNLDEVEGLGCFLDIDIHSNGRKTEEVLKQAEAVQQTLCIQNSQLIPFSYFELYLKSKSTDSGLDDESSVISDGSL